MNIGICRGGNEIEGNLPGQPDDRTLEIYRDASLSEITHHLRPKLCKKTSEKEFPHLS